MSFLRKLLGREKQEQAPAPSNEEVCPHTALATRWDEAADMGDESKATRFDCTACGQSFSPEEAERVRAEAGQRLRDDLA